MKRELICYKDISHIADRFDPISLEEVVFPSARTETYLQRWVSRSTSTRNLLLYGPPGTGKTRAAYLLAKERTKHNSEWEPIKYRECESGIADKLLQQLKDEVLTFAKTCDPNFETVVVLDEVDNFKEEQQQQLKKVLERSDYAFILLTNNLKKIDEGVRNRCYEIHWHIPEFERCVGRLSTLVRLAALSDVSEESLRRLYSGSGWRQMLRNIDALSLG